MKLGLRARASYGRLAVWRQVLDWKWHLFGPASAFDDIERTLEGGALELVSQFDYLNESNREEAGRVRALVDSWIRRFPAEARARLRERVRSTDDVAHLSAFFELMLHELLVRSGCRIVAVEPKMPGTDGAWHNGKEPKLTRVSAVLSTERVSPWNIALRRVRLILNPWAARPLPDVQLSIDVWRPEADALRKVQGATLTEIFGLSDGWPE